MHIIRAAQAQRFEVPGVEFTALAAPSRGSADICTWLITVASGLRSPESHTLDQDEVFMVLSGAVQLGPDAETLGPGDAAVVPAGTPIQICNPGDEPARVYVAIRAGFDARAADGTSIGTPPWAK
ncbi:cupin domain-containing protein [Krasilnikovia sp. MM14-A1259]|uniref:cupin domain-containing protein n=1 Tax=Krasilnikovia sp. MM14-A1259 TaxID=3373539 RepID=UPI00382A6636